VIPEHLVQQIRDAADIVAIIGEYSPLKRAGSSYRGPCPFHQGKDPNFSVTPGAGYTCFVCGEKGDVFTFVQRRLGLDFVGAVRLVADKAGVAFHEERTDVADPRAPFWEINGAAAEYFAQQLTAHQSALQYLWSRDLTRDHATTYGIGYAPAGGETRAYLASLGFDDARQIAAGLLKAGEDGRPPRCVFRDRLMFSIVDASGNLVGFGGRALGDFKPKYLNTAESTVFSKRNLLYGFQHAKFAARRAERIILVEGHFDAIRLWMAGIDEVVAPLGTMLTPEQAALIKRQVKTAYLLYDADSPGLKATFRAGDILLAAGVAPRVVTLPDGTDPDAFVAAAGRSALDRLIEASVDVFDKKIQILEDAGMFSDLARKRGSLDKLLPTIRAAKDPFLRDMYLTRTADVMGIRRSTLDHEAPPSTDPWERDFAAAVAGGLA
jgi:DNA primase